jgi:septal ring factor EnvC (AmiA/AmiB activator)
LSRFLYLLVLILAAASGWAATAPSITEHKEELKQLRSRIEGLQKRLSDSEASKSEAADALAGSERAISDTNRRLRELAGQRKDVDSQVVQLRADRDRTAARVEAEQTALARLINVRYRGGEPDALKLLLNADDPSRATREISYLGYLARSHATLIANLRADLARLNEIEAAAEKQSSALAAVDAEQHDQRARLETEKRARRDVLAKVSAQIAQQRREIATLKRDEDRLTKLVDELVKMLARSAARPAPRPSPGSLKNEKVPDGGFDGGPFAALKGRLRLPVKGELRNRFGSPREDSGLSWKGLFIAASAGEEVKSIAAGRVVFADWLRGFGNLLIIDHGGGYLSLYGNNEALYKRVGETTRGGETVAAVGNSGGNPDSGLYFEIRYQGKPFDPLSWVNLK